MGYLIIFSIFLPLFVCTLHEPLFLYISTKTEWMNDGCKLILTLITKQKLQFLSDSSKIWSQPISFHSLFFTFTLISPVFLSEFVLRLVSLCCIISVRRCYSSGGCEVKFRSFKLCCSDSLKIMSTRVESLIMIYFGGSNKHIFLKSSNNIIARGFLFFG